MVKGGRRGGRGGRGGRGFRERAYLGGSESSVDEEVDVVDQEEE